MADYLKGFEDGKADAKAGNDWADRTGRSDFYKDGYKTAYLRNYK